MTCICTLNNYRCPVHGPNRVGRSGWVQPDARRARRLKQESVQSIMSLAHPGAGPLFCPTCGASGCRGPIRLSVGQVLTWRKVGYPFEVTALRVHSVQPVVVRYLAGPAALRVVSLLLEVVRGKVRPLTEDEYTSEVRQNLAIAEAEQEYLAQEAAANREAHELALDLAHSLTGVAPDWERPSSGLEALVG